jgi:hypothetical protein
MIQLQKKNPFPSIEFLIFFFSWNKKKTAEFYAPPPVKVKRLLLGHGQTRGIMGIEIEMKQEEIDRDPQQEIVYFEELPWWLTIYLHTLKVEVDGIQIS